MTQKEIKEHFKVSKFTINKNLHLYSKTEKGKHLAIKYLCSLKTEGSYFSIVNSKLPKTNKIEKLKEDVESYLSTLDFDSEYYNPEFRDGFFEELVISDYLRNKGFEHGTNDYFQFTSKKSYSQIKTIELEIQNLDSMSEIKEDIEVKLLFETKWLSVKCKRNVYDIIKTIEGLLYPILLLNTTSLISLTDKFTPQNIEMTEKKISGFDVKSKEIKDELIEKLEKTLKVLKDN